MLISYLECYNERIYDLLSVPPVGGKRQPLSIKEDKNKHIFIRDLSEHTVKTIDQAKKLLDLGMRNRKVAETQVNRDSSRSHSIFTIKLAQIPENASLEEVEKNPSLMVYSKFSIIDLAGSERGSKTQAEGNRLREAGNINSSLMTLGKCIETMRYNQMIEGKEGFENKMKMVPFRESKLTRLFQDFFLGNGKATMVVNISSNSTDYEQTSQALSFATIAKHVIPTIKKQHVPSKLKQESDIKPIPFSLLDEENTSTASKVPPTPVAKPKTNMRSALKTKEKTKSKDKLAKSQKSKETGPKVEEVITTDKTSDTDVKREDLYLQTEEDMHINDCAEESMVLNEPALEMKDPSEPHSYVPREVMQAPKRADTPLSAKKMISPMISRSSSKCLHYDNLDMEMNIRSDVIEEMSESIYDLQKMYSFKYNSNIKFLYNTMKHLIKEKEAISMQEIKEKDALIQSYKQEIGKKDQTIKHLEDDLEDRDILISKQKDMMLFEINEQETYIQELKARYRQELDIVKEELESITADYMKQRKVDQSENETLKSQLEVYKTMVEEMKQEEKKAEEKRLEEKKSENKKSDKRKEKKRRTTTTKKTKKRKSSDVFTEEPENQENTNHELDIVSTPKKVKLGELEDSQTPSKKKAKEEKVKKSGFLKSPLRLFSPKKKEYVTKDGLPTRTPLAKRLRPRRKCD